MTAISASFHAPFSLAPLIVNDEMSYTAQSLNNKHRKNEKAAVFRFQIIPGNCDCTP